MITSRGNPSKVGGKPAPQSLEQKYHVKSPGERTRQLHWTTNFNFFGICDEDVINLFVCIYEVRKWT